MLRATAILLYLIPWAAGAQAPVWQWATALHGSTNVYIGEIVGSTLDGCFVSGHCYGDLYLPFDTLLANDGLGDHFVVHVDSLGAPDWAVRFSEAPASITPLMNGGLSFRFIVDGSVLVNGTALTSAPGTIDIGKATFDSNGTQTSLGTIDNVFQGTPGSPVWCDHNDPAGILLSTYVLDSLGVRDAWVVGPGIVVARFDAADELMWYALLEGSEFHFISGLHLSTNAKTIICTSDVSGDTQISTYSDLGEADWSTTLYGNNTNELVPVTRRLNDRVLIGAAFSSLAPSGGTSLVVEEYGVDGTLMNSSWASEPQMWNNAIRSLHDLPDGGSLVGGYQNGSLSFSPMVQNTTGPDGFVARIGPNGQWVWVTRENVGNVFGLQAAPGLNTRIYCAGTSDTGVQFGAYTQPFPSGGMYGVVACLGDIQLYTTEQAAQNIRTLLAWPNPAQGLLHLSILLPRMVQVFDQLGRDHTAAVLVKDANTLDVSRLPPGAYVIQLGMARTVFIKA